MAKITLANGAVFEGTAQECATFAGMAQSTKPSSTKKSNGKGKTAQPNVEMVPFTKHDGTVKYGTQAQVDAWTKYRDGYKSPEERQASKEANLAKWAKDKKAYKPSKELKNAIKANRAAITRKVAVEQYGFVGTKDDLKALKESVCK